MVTDAVQVTTPVQSLVGALDVFIRDLMGDVSHERVMQDEGNKARYERQDRPVITILVTGAERTDTDPYNNVAPVFVVRFSVTVRQRLVHQDVYRYRTSTFDRLWNIVDYLAGRLHNAALIPTQLGPASVDALEIAQEVVQANVESEGFTIRCSLKTHIDPLRDLSTQEIFRRPGSLFPDDPDAPEIQEITFRQLDGAGRELSEVTWQSSA